MKTRFVWRAVGFCRRRASDQLGGNVAQHPQEPARTAWASLQNSQLTRATFGAQGRVTSPVRRAGVIVHARQAHKSESDPESDRNLIYKSRQERERECLECCAAFPPPS